MNIAVARLKDTKRGKILHKDMFDLENLLPEQAVDTTDPCRLKGRWPGVQQRNNSEGC